MKWESGRVFDYTERLYMDRKQIREHYSYCRFSRFFSSSVFSSLRKKDGRIIRDVVEEATNVFSIASITNTICRGLNHITPRYLFPCQFYPSIVNHITNERCVVSALFTNLCTRIIYFSISPFSQFTHFITSSFFNIPY